MTSILPVLLVAAQLSASGAATSAARPMAIVIYSDFQCPFCRQFAKPTEEIRSKGVNGTPVTITFKHFPLAFHKNAPLAHQAAEAAKAQGKFWEMHDLLFANPLKVQRADLLGYARTLGLDLARFEADLDSDATKQAIAADIAEGTRAGITGTPSYVINGELYVGTRTPDQLASLLNATSEIRSVSAGRRIPDARPRMPTRSNDDITDAMLSLGSAEAPVTIELFADLQSPLTRAALTAVETTQRRYPRAIRVQFRSQPLEFHPQAMLAHEAAMVAARVGRFWEFVRAVVTQPDSMREDDLVDIARTLGLDAAEFRQALQQHRYRERVQADRDDASRRGLRGSPAVVVNDLRIDGVPTVQALTRTIEEALDELRNQSATRK